MDQDDGVQVDQDVVVNALDLVATFCDFVEELLVKRVKVMDQLIGSVTYYQDWRTITLKLTCWFQLSIGKADTWRQLWSQRHADMIESLRNRVQNNDNMLEHVSEKTLLLLEAEIGQCHGQKHLPILQLAREINVDFLNSNCTVTISVVRATDLDAADYNGLSDPYVKFRVGNKTHTSERVKTNLNPMWPDNAVDFIVSRMNPENLNVEVWDKDILTPDNHIGTLCVSLSPFVVGPRSSVQEVAYSLTVPEAYVGQNRESKLYLRIAVDNNSIAP